MAKSNYERLKTYRERKKMGEEVPKCKLCNRPLKGELSRDRGICSHCWKDTPEGKAETKANVEKFRKKP